MKDIKNWSPETDPYAEFMRADVPLQNRNEAFKETQAKPYLNSDAEVMLMQGDYGNSFFGSTMYTNEFSEHVLNFWQYADYYSPWHGAATAYTPDSLYDPVTSDWRARGFEFGIVNIPNPAYTNAAHKNGVMSIACIYFDPAFRPGQTCADMVEKDGEGNFPVADQLIAMAEYYGYDGYFLNQEEGHYEDFKPFMAYLTKHGLWTQWYDTNSSFNSSKSAWLQDSVNGQIHNSVFVNYGWNKSTVDSAIEHASSIGVDPFETVFFGAECNQNKLSGGHSSARNISNLYDETGNPRASVALFTPSDWYQRGVDDDLTIKSSSTPLMQQNEYQWMVAERERMFFSGVYCDPTDTGLKTGYSRSDVGVSNASGWVGVADFIAERSVINGTAFYTNFNTGHGVQYFKNGAVSKDEEWTNINIQDILPTWQWWITSTDDTKLAADFDYGAKYICNDAAGNAKTLPYTQVGAYDGGSSLVLYGELSGSDTMHLYKTDLDVNANSKAYLTFKKTSSDNASMQLGLIFKDAPETTEKVAVANSTVAGDWTTSTIDLSQYKDRSIAAITLEFEGEAENYQMNIGGLTVSDSVYKPEMPTGLAVDYAYADGQMIVSWDLPEDNYGDVVQYNLYGRMSDGSRVYLGGIYGDLLYVKSTFGEDEAIDLELCAVGKDGTESDPATLTYTYRDKVSNVKVEEAQTANGLLVRAATPGQLNVSFDAPETGAPDSYVFEVTLRNVSSTDPTNKVYTHTVDGSATSAQISLPVAEGREYDLKIYTVVDGEKGDAICYRGWSNDSYSEPIAEEDIRITGSTVRLVDPDSVDWYTMTASFEGTQVASFKRGASSGNKMTFTLPKLTGMLSVVVEDYAGNIKRADNSELSELVNAVSGYSEDNYTPETWEVFEKALEKAESVLADGNATAEEIADAVAELTAAKNQLVGRADKTLLKNLIDEVAGYTESDYTSDTWAVLDQALQEAQKVYEDLNASESEVANAVAALDAAKAQLLKRGDKSELSALADKAKETLESEKVYTQTTRTALEQALDTAASVLEKADAVQDEIDSAYAVLQAAYDGLVDITELTALCAEGEAVRAKEAEFTADSFGQFVAALDAAKEILENPNADQEAVDTAAKALSSAGENLKKSGESESLAGLLDSAKDEDLSKYTDESADMIRDAIEQAEKVIANRGTKEEVEEAYQALQDALNNAQLKPDEPSKPENPDTGDNMPFSLPIIFVLAAGAVFILRRRYGQE